MAENKDKFDPEGSGYDYQTAEKYGLSPDATGHWPSRVPETGLLLKGRQHKTWSLTEKAEAKSGYQIIKRHDRYYSLKKKVKNFMPENEKQFGSLYLLSRQVANEYYSPAFQRWKNAYIGVLEEFEASMQVQSQLKGVPSEALKPSEHVKQQRDLFVKQLRAQGRSEEEISAELGGMQMPAIDPVSAFAGGFVGGAKTAMQAGMKLIPSFGRAVTSGVVGATAEYPIGMATEKMEEKYPRLALPFTVALGLLSGVTVERAIERSVVNIAQKAGQKLTRAQIQKQARLVKTILSDETGAIKIKDSDKPFVGSAVKELNKEIGDLPAEKVSKQLSTLPGTKVGTGVPQTRTTIGEQVKTFLKFDPEITEEVLKSGNIRKFAANINLSRIEDADQLAEVYGKTVAVFKDELREARRGYRSNAQTIKAADMLNLTPKQLLARRKGVAFNAEEVTAARYLLATSADNLTQLAKKMNMLEATDLDRFEFRKALNLHYALQAQVSGMTAEAGRALQAHRIGAKSDQIKMRQIEDLMKTASGGIEMKEIAEKITAIDSLEGLNTFTRQLQRSTSKDMFLEAWINGLLSGPQTHAVNTLSNSLVAVWSIPERFLASGFSRVLRGQQAIRAREGVEQAFGIIQGFKDALKVGAKTAWTGQPSDPATKIEVRQYRAITAENVRQLWAIRKISPNALKEGGVTAHAVNFMGEMIRMPGRALMAEDEFFKGIGYRMELNARAYRKAVVEEGLKGKDAASRIREIINDPQIQAPDVHLAAIDAAKYQTFTNPLESKLIRAIQSSNNPAVRIIMPFVRTPTNIIKFAAARTPLAPALKSVREDLAAGGAQRDLALARISLGSLTMATIAILSAEGHITGGGPSDPKLKQYKYNQGWQPYSFKVGEKYYSYGRLEPLGMLFGLAADFTEISGELSEQERDQFAAMIVTAISKNVMSKTWLRGLSEIVSALDDPDRYGARWWNKFVGTVVPTGLAQVERVVSPELESVNSVLDTIKSRVPGWSKDLPVRRNLWAEAILLEGGLGPDIISPIYVSKERPSPIDNELYELKIPLQMPRKTQHFQGIPVNLAPHEYEQFLVSMNTLKLSSGKNLKDTLDHLVTKDQVYKDATNIDQKELMIRRYIREATALARQTLYYKNPEIQMIVNETRKRAAANQ